MCQSLEGGPGQGREPASILIFPQPPIFGIIRGSGSDSKAHPLRSSLRLHFLDTATHDMIAQGTLFQRIQRL